MIKSPLFKKSLFLIIIALVLFPTATHALGVSVIPSRLLVKTEAGQLFTQKLQVTNPSGLVGLYEAYSDDYADWLKVLPQSFTLEAGETRELVLQAKPPRNGIFATQLSVVASPLTSREFQAHTGLKVPLEIHVATFSPSTRSFFPPLTFSNIIFALDILLFLILLFVIIKRRAKIKSRA